MLENDTLNNIIWSILGLGIGAIGVVAAATSVTLSYLRGTNSGRFPLYCAFVAVVAAIALWFISLMSEPICSMVLAIATSLGAFMSVVYWLNRKAPR
jgi:FtsH-binding integral membrane protein